MKKRASLLYILFILAVACNIHCKVIRIDDRLLFVRLSSGPARAGFQYSPAGLQPFIALDDFGAIDRSGLLLCPSAPIAPLFPSLVQDC